jgi:recombinational DNA repair protein (RecF pathway)
MHTLHTTLAYVLDAYPHGESNYVYKLFTRNLGLLYAHAQSVRELKSKNKFALQTGHITEITLVRGREVWRITTAQHVPEQLDADEQNHMSRNVLNLIGKFLAVEDVSERVFDTMTSGIQTSRTCKQEDVMLVEAITILRIMDILGFVARPLEELVIAHFLGKHDFSKETIEIAREHKKTLLIRVNTALREAT